MFRVYRVRRQGRGILSGMQASQRSIQAFYEELQAKGLLARLAHYENLGTFLQYRKIFEVTSRNFEQGAKVLDWGCGNGHFCSYLLFCGAQVTGYSFDEKAAWLLGSPRFSLERGSLLEPVALPFGDESFDAVFSIGVLEHVHETGGSEKGSLLELWRVLRPGGRFLCFHLPNRTQWVEAVGQLVGFSEHLHRRKYTANEIRKMLAAARFTLAEVGRYNFLPRNWLRRLPEAVRYNRLFALTVDVLDRVLSRVLSSFCTCYYFVATKSDSLV